MAAKKDRKPPAEWDDQKRDRFLTFFRERGLFMRACEASGVSPGTVRNHLNKDPEFKALYEDAKVAVTEHLEAEAWRRATEGVQKPIIGGKDRDEVVCHEQVYSDGLLTMLLKGNMPNKYRDNVKVDANVTGGVLLVPKPLSVDEWKALMAEQRAMTQPEPKEG
jgi:hypothetical protein